MPVRRTGPEVSRGGCGGREVMTKAEAILEENCDVLTQMLHKKQDQADELKACVRAIIAELYFGCGNENDALWQAVRRAEGLLK